MKEFEQQFPTLEQVRKVNPNGWYFSEHFKGKLKDLTQSAYRAGQQNAAERLSTIEGSSPDWNDFLKEEIISSLRAELLKE